MAGAVCAQSCSTLILIKEEVKDNLYRLIGILYLIMFACLTFVFNFYAIVLAIIASPVGLGVLFYTLTDEYRYQRGLWIR